MTSRPSIAAPILAAIAIVVAVLGAYAAGYVWLGEVRRWIERDNGLIGITRVFPYTWQVTVFKPAAVAESWSRRIEVATTDVETWTTETAIEASHSPLTP